MVDNILIVFMISPSVVPCISMTAKYDRCVVKVQTRKCKCFQFTFTLLRLMKCYMDEKDNQV